MSRWYGGPYLVLALGLMMACTRKNDPQSVTSSPASPDASEPQGKTSFAGRLIILGFDGLDPKRLKSLMDRGKLPHFHQVATQGQFTPLRTTNPPQSPVAWAAFATGIAAGEHGIFDFVRRDAATYLPAVATTHLVHASQEGEQVVAATATNLRRGTAFWDGLAKAGIGAQAIFIPYIFPPDPNGAKAIAGLGVPDIRGSNSSFTLLTNNPQKRHSMPAGGQVMWLEGNPVMKGRLEGPRITLYGKRTPLSVSLQVRQRNQQSVELVIEQQKYVLSLGKTSPYIPIHFIASPLLNVHGISRFTLRQVKPFVEIYVEPISTTPQSPYWPFAAPMQFAQQLWQSLGPFKTVGWADDTSGLGADAIDERQFLQEAKHHVVITEQIVQQALADGSLRLIVAAFTAPDRIGHMFYRYLDPKHPGYVTSSDASHFRGSLDESYQWMDEVVGRVVQQMNPEDILLLMSDHGFSSFRRGLHLNSWLIQQGWMKLHKKRKQSRELFLDVDWSQTKAFAIGTGGIYLNIRGREAEGIVENQDAHALALALAEDLKKIRDQGQPVVADVFLGDSLFAGSQRREAPDLRVALYEGYRASWATTMGGAPLGLFEDNDKKWSGDHASSLPQDVPGILLSNKPWHHPEPAIEDLAATAYHLFGIPIPPSLIGRPLWTD